jgi:hypothetical protein
LLFKQPKSRAGTRWVPLVGAAQAALSIHRLAQEEERQACDGGYVDHDLVLCQVDGNPVRPVSHVGMRARSSHRHEASVSSVTATCVLMGKMTRLNSPTATNWAGPLVNHARLNIAALRRWPRVALTLVVYVAS